MSMQSPEYIERLSNFSAHLHVKSSIVQDVHMIKELRGLISSHTLYDKHREFCSDENLNRFLIAKARGSPEVPNMFASYQLLVAAIEWREKKDIDGIELRNDWREEMSLEGETGKIYIPGFDRYHRPLVVFDNTVQNTNNMEGQMKFLAWNLNLACRMMDPQEVDKYTIFMNLEKFSIFSCPSMACSKETINMLCNMFPERLGHCICYQGPKYFEYFFGLVKPFVDPKTIRVRRLSVSMISLDGLIDLLNLTHISATLHIARK